MASIPSHRLPPPPPPAAFCDATATTSITINNLRFLHKHRHHYLSPPSFRCRCGGSPSDLSSTGGNGQWKWDSVIGDVVKSAVKRWDDYVSSCRNLLSTNNNEGSENDEGKEIENVWDWERWKRHFLEIEEEEMLVATLKSQLQEAVSREDYDEAAKLKAAIVAAAQNDTVGSAIDDYNRAIKEERYDEAAFIRDHAGTGLVGWWVGISNDASDPYGHFVRITAEHGRYVARSYTPRQIMSAQPGYPLFEIYFTAHGGEYKQQAVYLKRNNTHLGGILKSPLSALDASSLNSSSTANDGKSERCVEEAKSFENMNEDADIADGLAGLESVLQDMIPGVKVKVLKVISPGKVDSDLIAKVIDQIVADDDEDNDEELEGLEVAKDFSIESEVGEETDDRDATNSMPEKQIEVSVKLVIGSLTESLSEVPRKDLVRLPARLETKDISSFSLSIKHDDKKQDADVKEQSSTKKGTPRVERQSTDLSMSDLAKVLLGKEQMPVKVLKDVGSLISSALGRNQRRPLKGTTLFSRIQIPPSTDPLNGLYMGAHGSYTSELLHVKCKFGQWKEEGVSHGHRDIEFYEYVEAVKLTGDLSLPAGEVAFRAKVGKRYQLPHRGIIPEEFGVIARYKGQGRIADPGFQNPRWVDGELVILDAKHVRGGPVIGFVYWTPGYPFLLFFNKLSLPD